MPFLRPITADMSIVPIKRAELAYAPRPWLFAERNRAGIEARFAELQQENPALWNGRVLLLGDHKVDGSVLRGSFLPVDYASFLVWHDWSCPGTDIRDAFAPGALLASDGAFLLGVMAPHTANAGKIYFPCGTPDPDDVTGATVDLDGNAQREVAEETGLTPADYDADPGWISVFHGPLIACIKVMRMREEAGTLRDRILRFLARERRPELCDIRIVRGPADLEPAMPPYVGAFLKRMWSAQG